MSDTIPVWIQNHLVEQGEIDFGGRSYRYFIVRPQMEPKLVGFVGFYQSEEFLFVSSDVPEGWRPHILRHELREFVEFAGREDRCVESLRMELDEVPHAKLSAYIPWRREFFERLVAYYTVQPHADLSFMLRIQASLDHLRELEASRV